MKLKREAEHDVVDRIVELEHQADQCVETLDILKLPRGLAAWATLTCLVAKTELHRATHRYVNYDTALVNLSRRGALILKWLAQRGKKEACTLEKYRWDGNIAQAVHQAFDVASNYIVFLSVFPMWHQERQLADVVAEKTIRFVVSGDTQARRVSAFHKGFKNTPVDPADTGLVPNIEQQRAFQDAVSRCFEAGNLRMGYPQPMQLYRLFLPTYHARLDVLFRRGNNIDLGPYTVADLKQVYAALTAVCATHESLCYWYGIRYRFPLNSCVMLDHRDSWVALLTEISGAAAGTVSAIVTDLTTSERIWDLHVQPFVSVDEDHLAVSPQFPLHSRSDENLMRVCGHVRTTYFDAASLLKEQEMLDDLSPVCPARFRPQPRIGLPGGRPNIDLLLVEEPSTVVIAELKWLRKPFDWRERIDRSKDFMKGLDQLSDIRSFLEAEPNYLVGRKVLSQPFTEYKRVRYVLVARDEFLWPEESDHLVVDYEVFKEAIGRTDTLAEIVDTLSRYEWLPSEGRDFIVRLEPASANGVTIETEIFYRNV